MASNSSDLSMLGFAASLAGSYLTFASTVIAAAVWPIAAILAFWMFRPHLVGLLPFVKRLELWGVKLDIDRHLDRAEVADAAMDASVGRALQPRPAAETGAKAPDEYEGLTESQAAEQLRQDPSRVSDSVLKAIAYHRIDGDAAYPASPFFDAWGMVRGAARSAAQAAGINTRSNVTLIGMKLADAGLVPPSLVRLLHELETVYEGIAQSPKSADLSAAIRFASLADRAIGQLELVKRNVAVKEE